MTLAKLRAPLDELEIIANHDETISGVVYYDELDGLTGVSLEHVLLVPRPCATSEQWEAEDPGSTKAVKPGLIRRSVR